MKASRSPRGFLTHFLVTLAMMTTTYLAATEQQSAGEDPDALTANHPWIGEPAPDFSLTSTGGAPITLSDFKGKKLLVIHFAASW